MNTHNDSREKVQSLNIIDVILRREARISEKWVQDYIFKILNHLKLNSIEISLVFTDNAEMKNLNKYFRNKDKTTDIISFPQYYGYNPETLLERLRGNEVELSPHKHLGDIVINLEKLEKESKEEKFEDRLKHLLLHGLLHLLGYTHHREPHAKKMENMEDKILSFLQE